MAVIKTRIFEREVMREGRFVTYLLTDEYGQERQIGPILEKNDVDTVAKAKQLEQHLLDNLKQEERENALRLAIDDGVNPANLVYRYNTKAAIINDLYSSKTLPLETKAAESLSKLQNINNKIRLFLGIV